MGLKLKSTNGTGSVELNAPANHNIDTSFTLPTSNFTGGEWVLADGNGNVNIDSGTLYVDAVNDRVGVGESNPSAGLHVVTDVNPVLKLDRGSANTANANWYYNGTLTGQISAANANFQISAAGASTPISFYTNGSARMAIAEDGEIIIAQGYDIAWRSDLSNTASTLRGRMTTSSTGNMTFHTGSSGTERMRITQAGDITGLLGPYNNTIATGVNLHITSAGTLKRVTSSAKYKTNIETLEDSYADNILNCRPVWYRALGDEENPEYSWYGFIAEEVAEIDPRLVQYREVEITYDEDGKPVSTPLAEPEPEGVSYERFVPHLVNLIKRQQARIETLEANNVSLEARLAALEGGTTE